MSFNAIWIVRPSAAARMRPKVDEFTAVVGFEKFVWLSALNHSVRNWSRSGSRKTKSFSSERSVLF
jgi:hypothetical protein